MKPSISYSGFQRPNILRLNTVNTVMNDGTDNHLNLLRDIRCAKLQANDSRHNYWLYWSANYSLSCLGPRISPLLPILEVFHGISLVWSQIIPREETPLSSAFQHLLQPLASQKLWHQIPKELSAYCIISSSSETALLPSLPQGAGTLLWAADRSLEIPAVPGP